MQVTVYWPGVVKTHAGTCSSVNSGLLWLCLSQEITFHSSPPCLSTLTFFPPFFHSVALEHAVQTAMFFSEALVGLPVFTYD